MNCDRVSERLDDWVNGTLSGEEAREVEAHVASCAACRDEHRRLRQVLAHAAALPRSVAPSRDLWPGIERRLARDRAWALWRTGWWSPVALAAAAAVVLGLGAGLLRQPGPAPVRTVEIPAASGQAGAGLQPAAMGVDPVLVAAERDYEAAANALLQALQQRKDGLAPETLASVEQNLAVIDDALAKVRSALGSDPGNPELNRMLVATHRKKVDVLRRVVRLSTAL